MPKASHRATTRRSRDEATATAVESVAAELLRQGSWGMGTTVGERAQALKSDFDAWLAALVHPSSSPGKPKKAGARVDADASERLLRAIFGEPDLGPPVEEPLVEVVEVQQRFKKVLLRLVRERSELASHDGPEFLTLLLGAAHLDARASNLLLASRLDSFGAQLGQVVAASHHGAARPPSVARRGVVLLSAAAIGKELGLVESTVHQRERKRQLFGYLPGQRQRGRVYPSFQLWEHVRGEPLERILKTLGAKPSPQDATFFAAINPDLLGSTPVEVLIGQRLTEREDGEQARRLLTFEPRRRLDAVLAAAEKFAAAGR